MDLITGGFVAVAAIMIIGGIWIFVRRKKASSGVRPGGGGGYGSGGTGVPDEGDDKTSRRVR